MTELDRYDYDLPPELIAQQPPNPRGASRALFVTRGQDPAEVGAFGELPHRLQGDECLVVNDTRVIPARVRARRETGGQVEVFFLRRERQEDSSEVWQAWISPSRRIREGESLRSEVDESVTIEVVARRDSFWWVRAAGLELLNRVGDVPIPPYIQRDSGDTGQAELDKQRYQTLFANEPGAVAAPTAGLHFTSDLVSRLESRGIPIVRVTLHVGPGTFQPVRAERLEEHQVAPEPYSVSEEAREQLSVAHRDGRRLIAVGTTSVRVLESLPNLEAGPGFRGDTDLTIRPGYRFRHVDGLITNFHLPKSSLLVLVAQFHGVDRTMAHYRYAVEQGMRFYSYGDAMFIAPDRSKSSDGK